MICTFHSWSKWCPEKHQIFKFPAVVRILNSKKSYWSKNRPKHQSNKIVIFLAIFSPKIRKFGIFSPKPGIKLSEREITLSWSRGFLWVLEDIFDGGKRNRSCIRKWHGKTSNSITVNVLKSKLRVCNQKSTIRLINLYKFYR